MRDYTTLYLSSDAASDDQARHPAGSAIARVTAGLFRKTRALHEANTTFLDGDNVTVTHRPATADRGATIDGQWSKVDDRWVANKKAEKAARHGNCAPPNLRSTPD
jgi:hypothetical protein